jgi:hypothetical protein
MQHRAYIYLRYLNDPMREVDEALRVWDAHDELTYAEIGHRLFTRGGERRCPARLSTGAAHGRLDRRPPPAHIGVRRVADNESHGNPGATSVDPADLPAPAWPANSPMSGLSWSSHPEEELGVSPAEWLFDPTDVEVAEVGLRNLLGAVEPLARDAEHDDSPDVERRARGADDPS